MQEKTVIELKQIAMEENYSVERALACSDHTPEVPRMVANYALAISN